MITKETKEQIQKAIDSIELTPDLIQRLARIHAMALQSRIIREKAQSAE